MEIGREEKLRYLFILEKVAKEVGERIANYKGEVYDIRQFKGHGESSIDRLAYSWMSEILEKYFHEFKGLYLYELKELMDMKIEGNGLVLRIDELDGTTNTKRRIASSLDYLPTATVSIALSLDDNISSLQIGVVYSIIDKKVFSGIFLENGFISFCDGKLLNKAEFSEKKGDDSVRIMVVGYSNKERMKKALIEENILKFANEVGIDVKIYDGSRSSSVDVLNIIKNQFDAYVDPRALFEDSGAMLYPYDIAGCLPIALGCGLEVFDNYGNPISSRGNIPLTLVVARKGMKEIIVKAINEAVKR